MTTAQSIIKEALAEIRPTKEEQKEKKDRIDAFMKKLKKSVTIARPVLGGSAKKDTWLRDSYDADIFVTFNNKRYRERSDELSDILQKQLKGFRFSRIHGSRDYFQITEKGLMFEIIPILDIRSSDQAINITDISPLHAKWVVKNVSDPDQVRLAKAFTKSQEVYGAESFIKGFSGYSIEILMVYYGNFLKFLKGVSRWKERTVIDIEKYHKNIMIEVNQSKLVSPLVLIDPVQKGRNVAAAVSAENYRKLIKVAKAFLARPGKRFFETRIVTEDMLKKRFSKKTSIILSVTPKKGKEDVIGSKLLKSFENISRELTDKGFTVKEKGWFWDRKKKCLFWFITKEKELPKIMEWQGPPAELTDYVKEFKKRYRKTYVKKGIIYSTVKRKETIPEKAVKAIISEQYIREKVKEVRFL